MTDEERIHIEALEQEVHSLQMFAYQIQTAVVNHTNPDTSASLDGRADRFYSAVRDACIKLPSPDPNATPIFSHRVA